MTTIRWIGKMSALLMLAITVSGCVVVPYGYGPYRHGRGYYTDGPGGRQPIIGETPRGDPGRSGR